MFLRLAVVVVSIFSTVVWSASDDQEPSLIFLPPRPEFNGTKLIPDAAHPFIAPGPGDQRGPCPALNTLANHGYLPRTGVASYQQIIEATAEGFNMERNLSAALTAFGMLARGNPYLNLLSIGGPTPLVPPLPGNLDGNVTKGLATNGRFEGDVSMTREDFLIGDNRNFQQHLFDQWLKMIDLHGDIDKETGKRNIVNPMVMAEVKTKRYVDDKVNNPSMKYDTGRFILSYGETGFVLELFANGTTGILSRETLTSIFRDQRFPEHWYRRSAPASFELISNTTGLVINATDISVVPGSNDGKGTFIPDAAFNETCTFQIQIIQNSLPGVLINNSTGILKKNSEFLVAQMNNVLGSPLCPDVVPDGPAGA